MNNKQNLKIFFYQWADNWKLEEFFLFNFNDKQNKSQYKNTGKRQTESCMVIQFNNGIVHKK